METTPPEAWSSPDCWLMLTEAAVVRLMESDRTGEPSSVIIPVARDILALAALLGGLPAESGRFRSRRGYSIGRPGRIVATSSAAELDCGTLPGTWRVRSTPEWPSSFSKRPFESNCATNFLALTFMVSFPVLDSMSPGASVSMVSIRCDPAAGMDACRRRGLGSIERCPVALCEHDPKDAGLQRTRIRPLL